MKKILISLLSCALLACGSAAIKQDSTHVPTPKDAADYYTLLSSLLSINDTQYSYTDANGNRQPDSLAQFKALENFYSAAKATQTDGSYSDESLTLLMFFAFYAEHKNNAAFNEYLATDLQPIFLRNPEQFIRVLSENSFMLPATCDRIGAHFLAERYAPEDKEIFTSSFKPLFKLLMEKDQSTICLNLM